MRPGGVMADWQTIEVDDYDVSIVGTNNTDCFAVGRTDDPAADARRARLFTMAEVMAEWLRNIVRNQGIDAIDWLYIKHTVARLDGDAETGGKD